VQAGFLSSDRDDKTVREHQKSLCLFAPISFRSLTPRSLPFPSRTPHIHASTYARTCVRPCIQTDSNTHLVAHAQQHTHSRTRAERNPPAENSLSCLGQGGEQKKGQFPFGVQYLFLHTESLEPSEVVRRRQLDRKKADTRKRQHWASSKIDKYLRRVE